MEEMRQELVNDEVKNKALEEFNNLSIDEILRDIAEEEGMEYHEVVKMFKQGIRETNGVKAKKKVDKSLKKKKRKMASKSKKKNRK